MVARKKEEETVSMVDTFKEFKDTKNIDRTTLMSVLEESFRNVIAKIFGSDENFDVIVNPDKGDFEIYRNRIVVADGEVKDQNKEIALSDAIKIEPDYEVGEEVSEKVDFSKFGRRAILNLRQTLASKVLELNTTASTTSIKTAWARLSPARYIRCGSAKCCSLTTRTTSSSCPSRSRYLTTFTARARPCVP